MSKSPKSTLAHTHRKQHLLVSLLYLISYSNIPLLNADTSMTISAPSTTTSASNKSSLSARASHIYCHFGPSRITLTNATSQLAPMGVLLVLLNSCLERRTRDFRRLFWVRRVGVRKSLSRLRIQIVLAISILMVYLSRGVIHLGYSNLERGVSGLKWKTQVGRNGNFEGFST
jgi:hypothetical protein